MVGRSDHQDPVVGFQPVDFIEEVRSYIICDEGVEVFEDKEARGLGAGLAEDGLDAVFRAAVGGEGADVEGWDGGGGVKGEGVHHCFDGDCFAVAW